MRYRLLGVLEVEADDGSTLPIAAPRRRAVLAYLLLHAGRVVGADELIEALWGEDPPPAALESLQAHVSRLRRELPAGTIRSRPPGYELATRDGEVDVAVAEALIARGRRAARAGRVTPAREDLAAALALWRGPALDGLGAEPFAAAHAHRLDELRLTVLEERLDLDLRLGLHREVADELETLVAQHPLREGLWRQWMLALYRCGRQADALAAYRRVRRILREELGIDPSPDLQALERQVLQQDPALAASAFVGEEPAVRLPRSLTRIVGREADLGELGSLMRVHRLVTLLGPGGVGKTRLAVAAAERAVAEHSDGTLFVDLSPVREETLLLASIGRETGGGDRPAQVIGEREMLLVLDNFEQIVDAAPAVSDLLRRCPRLHVVVTSRVPLRVEGEQLFDVEPLGPGDAATLFAERARQALRRWEPDAAVGDVVQRLDYLPLAIEIAAAQVRGLTSRDLLAQMTGAGVQRRTGRRDSPARQRTLRDTIAWSYALLGQPDRTAFRGLSAFAGRFDARAAGAVARADVDQLRRLVESSLLGTSEDRFVMLETIREFAAEEAETCGETPGLRARHLAHYVEVMAGVARDQPHPHWQGWLAACNRERDNLHRAYDHAVATRDLPALKSLVRGVGVYWLMVGALDVGETWAQTLVDLLPPDDVQERGKSLLLLAEYPRYSGDHARAIALRREAVALARQAGDANRLATLLDDLSFSLGAVGAVDEAQAAASEALSIRMRAPDDAHGLAHSLSALSDVALRAGDCAAALDLVARTRAVEGSMPALPVGWSIETDELEARALLLAGRRDEAEERYRGVVRDAVAIDMRITVLNGLVGLASAIAGTEPMAAARLLGMADRLHAETRIGYWDPAEPDDVAARAQAAVASSGGAIADLADARRAGRALDLDAIRAEVAGLE